MPRLGFSFASIALFAIVAVGQDKDTVEIKLGKMPTGERIRITRSSKTSETQLLNILDETNEKVSQGHEEIVCVEQFVIGVGRDEKEFRLVRTYEKYDATKDGKTVAAPLLNTPITIEKKDGKVSVTADGKPLEKAFSAKLEVEFSKPSADVKNEELLPGKPVKVGETWTLDPDKLIKALSGGGKPNLDARKGSVTGKLVKVYSKGNQLFGVMEFAVNAPVTEVGIPKDYKLKPGARLATVMTIDTNIDGAVRTFEHYGAKIDMKMELDGGPGVSVAVTSRVESKEIRELVKKD